MLRASTIIIALSFSPGLAQAPPVDAADLRQRQQSVVPVQACGACNKNCSQMRDCEEAYYCLNTCGKKRLDRDRDGIPCETICK